MNVSTATEFDHGAAIRVPAAQDRKGWRSLMTWLGANGRVSGQAGIVEVDTPFGSVSAGPGDWIVLSFRGVYHVAGPSRRSE
jgi:hypothetical protein